MAKRAAPKQAAPKKATPKNAPADFTPSVTNLKFIGAAFDVAIADLQKIKLRVEDRGAVDAKIEELQALKATTESKCPQSWYIPYVLVD